MTPRNGWDTSMTISNSSKVVPWELTSDGRAAERIRLPTARKAGAFLRALAYAKLTSVHAVSAAFRGEPIYFERRIVILNEETSSMRVTSLFVAAETTGDAPGVCIRTAKWEREADYRSFEAAPSKGTYALSSKQVEGRIRFYTEGHDRVLGLLNDTENRFRQGILIPGAAEMSNFMRVEAYFDQFNFCISFSCESSRDLEAIAKQWESELAQLARSPEVEPDEGCSISHEPSVWERIDSFTG